jgi:glycosyltransferase involved in cell wall biosynthesis
MIRTYLDRARKSHRVRHGAECLAQWGTVAWHRLLPSRQPEAGMAILDDYFPNPLTGFRISEFNCYLETDPGCRVYCEHPQFDAHLRAYEQHFPGLAPRIAPWRPFTYLHADLAYSVFINNIYRYLPVIERHRLPFVFTLYPGGGFRLEDGRSDRMLRRVCGSRWFRKVIATQKVSRDYLLDRQFCRPEQIEMIFGGVFASDVFDASPLPRRRYGADKGTFDICFAAHKYMPKGVDKGYDVFVRVAHLLAEQNPDYRFHVIGGFGPDETDVAALGDRIRFYGSLYRDAMRQVYAGMDLILSPNVPFILFPGAFDGFPTGCCIEAGLSGVAVFCTDPLDCNAEFADGEEIVLIPRDPAAIAEIITSFQQDPDRLYRIASNGQGAFTRVFDLQAQMAPRLRVLAGAAGRS